MKILLYDNSGHPFQVQLSRSLAKEGHNVLHIFSESFQTPKGNLTKTIDDSENFNIKGIRLNKTFSKYSYIKRWFQEVEMGKKVSQEILLFNPDVVISSNVPLDTQRFVLKACKRNNIKFIFWLQDFYGIAINNLFSKKIPIIGSLIGKYYVGLEKRLLKASAQIIVITKDFVDVLSSWRVDKSKIHILQNWAPLDEMPQCPKENDWSKQQNLDGKFSFIYSGTLGLKHNPELLLNLAIKYQSKDDVRILVISEGLGAEWLKKEREEYKLNNLIILGFQPFSKLPEILGTADVLIAILESDAGIYSVPSKVLSYLCAGRALLLAVPKENLAAKIVKDNKAGILVEPNNNKEFLEGAVTLYENIEQRSAYGLNARRYAEKEFNITNITLRVMDILKK